MFSEALALSRFKQPVMESKHSSNKHLYAHANTYNNNVTNEQTPTHIPTDIKLARSQLVGIGTILAMIVIMTSSVPSFLIAGQTGPFCDTFNLCMLAKQDYVALH